MAIQMKVETKDVQLQIRTAVQNSLSLSVRLLLSLIVSEVDFAGKMGRFLKILFTVAMKFNFNRCCS